MPSFPLVRPRTALTAWVALDDATDRSGCMLMVPGSHRWGDAADLAGDDWSVPGVDDLRTYHGHPVRIVPRPVRRGHVHLHHELLWHCSASNLTRGKRRALAIHFAGAGDRYRAASASRSRGSPTARRWTPSRPWSSRRTAADRAAARRRTYRGSSAFV